ncbi:MAG: DciA family protein [Rhodanobacteraceae bacterium]
MPPNRRSSRITSKAGPRPLAECINTDALADYARALDALDDRLRRHLPAGVARECRLADVRNGRVVFLASSSTWAARLRLHQATLLAAARTALGGGVERFAVKVAPLPSVPPEPAKRKPLSATAARHLRAAAQSLTDPELRALYLRLASFAMDDSP